MFLLNEILCKALLLVGIVEKYLLMIILVVLVSNEGNGAFAIHKDSVGRSRPLIRFVVERANDIAAPDVHLGLSTGDGMRLKLRSLLLPMVIGFVDLAAEYIGAVGAHDLEHGLAASRRKHTNCFLRLHVRDVIV